MKLMAIVTALLIVSLIGTASGDVVVTRWFENVELNADGSGDVVLQIELVYSEISPLKTLIIQYPAKNIEVIREDTLDFRGALETTIQKKGDFTILSVDINRKTGQYSGEETWNGRIHFKADGLSMVRDDSISFSRNFEEVTAVLEDGQEIPVVFTNSSVSPVVSLPEKYEVVSFSPQPWKMIFQYSRMKVLWREVSGDTPINVEGKYSELLNILVTEKERLKTIEKKLKDAGREDMSEDVIKVKESLNLALGYFEEDDRDTARDYIQKASTIMDKIEEKLTTKPVQDIPQEPTSTPEAEKTPGFGWMVAVTGFLIIALLKRYM
jgi:hypothetical protein